MLFSSLKNAMCLDFFHWHGPTELWVLLDIQLWNSRRRVGKDQQQKSLEALQNLQNWKALGFCGKGGVQRTQGWLSLEGTSQGLSFQTWACIVVVHSVQFCLLSLPLACAQSSVGPSSIPLNLLLYCSRRTGKNRRIKHSYSGKVGPGGQCELAWEANGEYSWRSVTVSCQSSCSRDLSKAMGKRETDLGFPLFRGASVAQFWHDWATWKEAVPEGPYGARTSKAD